MSHEATLPPIFNEDGSLNEGELSQQFGLGVTEATQVVNFGAYSGTVAEMLSDARCPVGGMVRKAFESKGIEGVVEKFEQLGQLDPQFKVKVAEATIETHVKKNQKNQIFPTL